MAQDGDILLGLLGQSLGHSLSPVIHQAFFDELGLSGRYDKIEVPDAASVPSTLEDLSASGYRGLNVTIPYKLTVLPQLAALDDSATLAGAVNTIKFDPTPTGYNTDISGLAEALYQLDLSGEGRVVVLGNGGAARAAVIAVSTLGFKSLQVVSRDPAKARGMLDQLLQTAERQSLIANCRQAGLTSFEQLVGPGADFHGDVSLVINATPIGQKDDHIPDNLLQFFKSVGGPGKCFVDLVYGKAGTPLTGVAQQAGFERIADGMEMLIQQARLAFKIWTGQLPDGQLARKRLNEKA